MLDYLSELESNFPKINDLFLIEFNKFFSEWQRCFRIKITANTIWDLRNILAIQLLALLKLDKEVLALANRFESGIKLNKRQTKAIEYYIELPFRLVRLLFSRAKSLNHEIFKRQSSQYYNDSIMFRKGNPISDESRSKYEKAAKLIKVMELTTQIKSGHQRIACEIVNCQANSFSQWKNKEKNIDTFFNWQRDIPEPEQKQLFNEIQAHIKKSDISNRH